MYYVIKILDPHDLKRIGFCNLVRVAIAPVSKKLAVNKYLVQDWGCMN